MTMTATVVYTSETIPPDSITDWCDKCWHYATLNHVCEPCCMECCGNCGQCRFPTQNDPSGLNGPVIRGNNPVQVQPVDSSAMLSAVGAVFTDAGIPEPFQVHLHKDGVVRCEWVHPGDCWTVLEVTPPTETTSSAYSMFHVTGNPDTERHVEHADNLTELLIAFADVFVDAIPNVNGPAVHDWRT